jgi:uncharacterized membrane protein YvlD (DUF360 family)
VLLAVTVLVPGITIESAWGAAAIAAAFGAINAGLRPGMRAMSLPADFLTVAAVALLMNTLLLGLASLVPGQVLVASLQTAAVSVALLWLGTLVVELIFPGA